MVLSDQRLLGQLKKAQQLQQQGLYAEAKKLLKITLDKINDSYTPNKLILEQILFALAKLSIQTQQVHEAIPYLQQLLQIQPNQIYYCDFLADIYGRLNRWSEAADSYTDFIKHNNTKAEAYYNRAYNLKQAAKYQDALENYQLALSFNITQSEEVYLNIAVIYSDHLRQENKAKEALKSALKINSSYTSALYNLANLYEEEGSKKKATELFEKVLALDPNNLQSLARLADVKKFIDVDDIVIQKLASAVKSIKVESSTKINLHYALAKTYDDCGYYKQAFDNYLLANNLDAQVVGNYEQAVQQQNTDANIELFSKSWFNNLKTVSDAEPVFICGMFRSGSTLIEQMLASHPEITAGGERDYFFRLSQGQAAPYPGKAGQFKMDDFVKYCHEYTNDLKMAFPESNIVTDKRPDNFLYIGLIKSIFPKAKIIHTKRNMLDNCLSVYFLRLGRSMNYATSIKNIIHYYNEQNRLMEHWKSIFPDTIIEADYDKLVEQPKATVEEVLGFLSLDWNDNCLNFHSLKNRVKTASVWRVRQPLYKSSSGRWKNYQEYIPEFCNKI